MLKADFIIVRRVAAASEDCRVSHQRTPIMSKQTFYIAGTDEEKPNWLTFPCLMDDSLN